VWVLWQWETQTRLPKAGLELEIQGKFCVLKDCLAAEGECTNSSEDLLLTRTSKSFDGCRPAGRPLTQISRGRKSLLLNWPRFLFCTSLYSYSLFSWKLISLNIYCFGKCLYSIVKYTYTSSKKRGITLIIIGFVSKNTFQVGSLLSFSTVMSPSAAVQKRKSMLASFRS